MSPARTVAFRTLLEVDAGGYASDLLLQYSAALDSRDAGLASEIVFGVLRFQAQLDYLAEKFSGRSTERLDTSVLLALRMGVYQLRHLDRVPAHAIINESVELIKRSKERSAAGFVNAVLRKIQRAIADGVPFEWPDRATELSHPAWLLESWERRYGFDQATAIARANLQPPETYVRVPGGAVPPPECEPTVIPGCCRLPSGRAAGFRIQDIGSQSIVPLLDLSPGLTFLDLCAAPGNKTAQALESGVKAIACDLSVGRLRGLSSLGIDLVALDAARPLPFAQRFDRILLDVPCAGTGTLARNPEIKWRLQPSDIENLKGRQIALLQRARQYLAPGGKLVYSTCSLQVEENEGVVERVPRRLVERTMHRLPGRQPGDGFFAAVIRSD
ncbi:MAG: transcription antitermination factor NusB [Bryobacteraceae bacterium]